MNNNLISIIIPVYNAEKYISECIESVLVQSYRNIELILVDDGSTDTSGMICETYARDIDFIIYTRQDNKGVSSARNKGMKMASGSMIMFLDADDLLPKHICKIINDNIGNYDLILFDMKKFVDIPPKIDEDRTAYHKVKSLQHYTKKKLIGCLLGDRALKKEIDLNLASVWAKAYKKDVIFDNCVWFSDAIPMGEDLLFNLRIFLHSPKICYLSEVSYYYRYNAASAVHKYNPKVKENDDKFFRKLTRCLESENLLQEFMENIICLKLNGLARILAYDIFHYNNPKRNKDKKYEFYKLLNRNEYKQLLSENNKNILSTFSPLTKTIIFLSKYKMYYSLKIIFCIKYAIKK